MEKVYWLEKWLILIENDIAHGVITCNAEEKALKTWNTIPDTFICLKRLAIAILSIFSSTYCGESLFSQMNMIKNNLRSLTINDSSSACISLKVTEYEPDIRVKRLASKVQPQRSHWYIALYGYKCIVGNNLYTVHFALVLFNVTTMV